MNINEEIIELKTKKAEKIHQLEKKRAMITSDKIIYEQQLKAKWILVEVSRQSIISMPLFDTSSVLCPDWGLARASITKTIHAILRIMRM